MTPAADWRRDVRDRKRPPRALSREERDNVRRALRSIRIKLGRGELAARMGLTYDALRKTLKRPPTMRVAVLVAYVAGVSVDDVLSGVWPGDRCPVCGGTGLCRRVRV